MSTTLRDFIPQRKAEIRDQIKALKAELKELQVAETALEGQEAPAVQAAAPTIKDMARAVLADASDGFTSQQILAAIKKDFGREIDRTSLSPQLSRLKDAGEITLEGDLWITLDNWNALQQRVENEFDDLTAPIDWSANEPLQDDDDPDPIF